MPSVRDVTPTCDHLINLNFQFKVGQLRHYQSKQLDNVEGSLVQQIAYLFPDPGAMGLNHSSEVFSQKISDGLH